MGCTRRRYFRRSLDSTYRDMGVFVVVIVLLVFLTHAVPLCYSRCYVLALVGHHSGGAGAQSRFIQLTIQGITGQRYFIDSDHLGDWTGALTPSIPVEESRHEFNSLTRLTATRPWCVWRNNDSARQRLQPCDYSML